MTERLARRTTGSPALRTLLQLELPPLLVVVVSCRSSLVLDDLEFVLSSSLWPPHFAPPLSSLQAAHRRWLAARLAAKRRRAGAWLVGPSLRASVRRARKEGRQAVFVLCSFPIRITPKRKRGRRRRAAAALWRIGTETPSREKRPRQHSLIHERYRTDYYPSLIGNTSYHVTDHAS